MTSNPDKIKECLNIGYRLVNANNEPIHPDGIHFILQINSDYEPHAKASKKAFKAYADAIKEDLPYLADTMLKMLNQNNSK